MEVSMDNQSCRRRPASAKKRTVNHYKMSTSPFSANSPLVDSTIVHKSQEHADGWRPWVKRQSRRDAPSQHRQFVARQTVRRALGWLDSPISTKALESQQVCHFRCAFRIVWHPAADRQLIVLRDVAAADLVALCVPHSVVHSGQPWWARRETVRCSRVSPIRREFSAHWALSPPSLARWSTQESCSSSLHLRYRWACSGANQRRQASQSAERSTRGSCLSSWRTRTREDISFDAETSLLQFSLWWACQWFSWHMTRAVDSAVLDTRRSRRACSWCWCLRRLTVSVTVHRWWVSRSPRLDRETAYPHWYRRMARL